MSLNKGGRRKKESNVIAEKAEFMRYNPLIASSYDVSPIRVYPELSGVEGFVTYLNLADDETERKFRSRALWYAIWLYSNDTVLNTKPPENLPDRKLKALALTKFSQDDEGRFDERVVADLMKLEDQDFVIAALHYLRHQKGDIFGEIIICEEQLYEAQRLRLAPVDRSQAARDTEMKKKLRQESKELQLDIRAHWDEFFQDHDDLREDGIDLLYQTLEDRARVNTGGQINGTR